MLNFKSKKIFLSFLIIIIYFFVTNTAYSDEISFDHDKWNNWLVLLKKEVTDLGVSNKTINSIFPKIKPIKRVIELDKNQPEFKLTFNDYLNRVVTNKRIEKGKKYFNANEVILNEIYEAIGVQPRFIVALWGIETDFGRLTGGFKVIDALATLAFEGRRASYFRKELINAIKIVDQGHITYSDMFGSWAGAMGQPQFWDFPIFMHLLQSIQLMWHQI